MMIVFYPCHQDVDISSHFPVDEHERLLVNRVCILRALLIIVVVFCINEKKFSFFRTERNRERERETKCVLFYDRRFVWFGDWQ